MIWLVGDKGMLGKEVAALLEAGGAVFVRSDKETDIRDPAALRAFAEEAARKGGAIEWIVNCSAYTAVDKCEDEFELARTINAAGAGNLAELASAVGAALLHISTDYVFDGKGIVGPDGKPRPWLEDDPVDPVNAYGRTKAEGEALVRGALREHLILRTAWLYGIHGPNFVATMLRLMTERDSLSVVADQFGNPTWARDLAGAIVSLVAGGKKAPWGTYHYTGAGVTSWHGFATAIRDGALKRGLLAKEIPVRAITSAEYPSKAKRPAWSALSKDKIAALGIAVPRWEESLSRYLDTLAKKEGK